MQTHHSATQSAPEEHSRGAERTALDAAISLAALFKTCLGPDGRNKLIATGEETIVTNDIHRIFDVVDIPDPVGRFVIQHVVAQKEDVGDGSLTTLLLAGALCRNADRLLDDGYRRATIEDGYDKARAEALAELQRSERAIGERSTDRASAVRGVARGALNSFRAELVDIVVDAATQIHTERRKRNRGLDLSDIRIRLDDKVDDAPVELIQGLVLDRDVVHESMARRVEQPRIAIIGGGKKAGSGIEERSLFRAGGSDGEGRTEVTFSASDADDITALREAEAAQVRAQVARLEDTRVDAVFCTMGISDVAKRLLHDADITAFRTLTETDAALLARATGGTVVLDIADLTEEAIGTAGRLVVDSTDNPTVTIAGCPKGTVATLRVSGALGEYRTERERDFRAAIAVVLDVLSEETVVPAGGGIEIRLATAVREHARTVGDRRAVAMDAYADALEEIPRTLATNGGVAAIDIVTELRRCEDSGFDTASGDVREAFPAGPLVSPRVVSTSLETATHIATRLVRIDDVLTGGEDEEWISADEIDPRPVPSRDFDY